MAKHPLDEDLDLGLEQIKDRLQAQTELDTRVEVGEIVAAADSVSVTVTIDGSGDMDEYVATVYTGGEENECRSTNPDEVLENILNTVARADGGIDLPAVPQTDTYEHSATDPDDGTDIQFTFRADPDRGQIKWTAEWDGGETSGYTDELSDKHGAIIYRHNPRINGEKTRGSKLDDEMLAALKEDLDAVKQYRQEKREAEKQAKLNEELILAVEAIKYQTGTHRTKYTVSARVLKPSKDERHWDEDEQKLMDALRRELGESNDYPSAEGDDDTENPFEDVEDGATFTVDEAASRVDGVEETVAEIDAELEREQMWKDLVSDHPALRGTNADPETVRESLNEAADLGEKIKVASGTASCSDPNKECSLDRLTYYATPNGEIDVSQTHTY
jgi:hypothetical protein